jgi:hypothetical protein
VAVKPVSYFWKELLAFIGCSETICFIDIVTDKIPGDRQRTFGTPKGKNGH